MKQQQPIPVYSFSGNEVNHPSFVLDIWKKEKQMYDFSSPHRHDFDEIIFFFKGGGVHEIDFTEIEIKDYSLHFVKSGQVHHLLRSPDSSGCSLLIEKFFFTNQAWLSFAEIVSSHNHLNLSKPLFAKFYFILRCIYNYGKYKNGKKSYIAAEWVQLLLAEIRELEIRSTENRKPIKPGLEAKYNEFLKLLELYWKEHLSVEYFSKKMAISSNYLNKICKLICGKSPTSIINEKLVSEAKRELYYSTKSIKEITYSLNFEDPSYFIRFFKKNTGYTPHEYRHGIKVS